MPALGLTPFLNQITWGVEHIQYRCCITELYNFLNQGHPHKFNKKVKIITGYKDLKINQEEFVLPYIPVQI